MPEPQSWRTVLGTFIKEPQQRQKIASELGVDPITLTRWVEKKSNPRLESLRRLLSILPQQRALLLPLIGQEFPEISSEVSEGDALSEAVPPAFYQEVLSRLSSLPQNKVVWPTCQLILRQAFEHLDPQHRSVAVFITQCIPPAAGNKVRSLRSAMGVGVSPWGGNVEQQTILLGAETVPGRVVSSGQPKIVQSYQHPRQTGAENIAGIASSCTYPLLRANHVLGTFGAISTLPDYFPPSRQKLVEQYTELVSAVFSFNAFYALENIELGIMPSPVDQLPYLMTFQTRVRQVMTEAMTRKEPMTHLQAEQLVWQQLEDELLRMALLKN